MIYSIEYMDIAYFGLIWVPRSCHRLPRFSDRLVVQHVSMYVYVLYIVYVYGLYIYRDCIWPGVDPCYVYWRLFQEQDIHIPRHIP